MDPPAPGHFWKTPFLWEPGCPEPQAPGALRFEPCEPAWLVDAIAAVMADSLDESDHFAVERFGARGAAEDLLAAAPQHFEHPATWWRRAVDAAGRPVGFVLPVLFQDRAKWKDGRPLGTVFYMGVLPACRGQGHGAALLAEATRVFIAAHCWRIFCDASSRNTPMLDAFRRAGWHERQPWQRPLG